MSAGMLPSRRSRAGVLGLIAFFALAPWLARASEALPKLGVKLDATSVSGLSAGAYVAGQIELTHGSHVNGAGIVAGGPFACAESPAGREHAWWNWWGLWANETQSLTSCMQVSAGAPDGQALAERAKELAQAGELDPLTSLSSHKVFLFTGGQDRVVRSAVVEAAAAFYRALGVPEGQIHLEPRPDAGHSLVTVSEGSACGTSDRPFVSHCGYSVPRELLEWIYGPLADPSPAPSGRFIVFDQSAFFSEERDGLAAEAVVYVPTACDSADSGCRLHVVLHGCEQNRDTVHDDFIKESGFAELADTNKLVILFPQTSPVAPNGCFDWWGYTGLDFMGKDAPQIAAIWAMVERLAARP
jgi:poly(3-hydroxybutyrate) depolymerase